MLRKLAFGADSTLSLWWSSLSVLTTTLAFAPLACARSFEDSEDVVSQGAYEGYRLHNGEHYPLRATLFSDFVDQPTKPLRE
jgi:hypothetical protein